MKQNPTAPVGYEPESPPPSYDIGSANNATKPIPTPVQFQSQLQPQQVQVQPQTQPPQVVILEFGEDPMFITCPYCDSSTITRTEYKLGVMSWLLCLTVSICCLCCDFNKDVLHSCPHCNMTVGQYRRPCTKKIVLIIVFLMVLSAIVVILNIMMMILTDLYNPK
uniref:LITAF domain-containing protein n=1 Tax=Acrobeloides nanus TaxID=290746 RepID=A0A914BW86_9BILA